MHPRTVLRLSDLTKRFGGRPVLRALSLEVFEGESLVIMGPSGGGKTVLLKHLIGLLRPDAGRLEVDGVDFWATGKRAQEALRQRFGMVFQEGALFDSMNVFDNVAFPLRRHARHLTPAEVGGRVSACLQLVRLQGAERLRPSELSTGMRRRVGLARALMLEPRFLLFDEPTAGLDPILVTVIDQVILDVTRRLKLTSVTVTHDLRTARRIGDRVALLMDGVLVADAPAAAFFHLENAAVRRFIEGRPEEASA